MHNTRKREGFETFYAWIIAMAIIACVIPTSSYAGEDCPECELIKVKFEKYGATATQVTRNNELGLYEIISGGNAYYTDENVRHLIFGHLLDPVARKDMTKATLDKLSASRLSSLPFNQAIVSGDKNAKKSIIVFTDPDCPYCRRLEPELVKLTGVKIYTFLFPLTQLHPRAMAHSQSIWCAPDKTAKLHDVMLNNADPTPPASCNAPIASNIALGQRLGVTGTPTVFRMDGERWGGAATASQMQAWLEE